MADITYIETKEGWLYLAAILDLFSRKIVGWAMSERIDTVLVLNALAMALRHRRPPAKLLFHTDRGVQYASGDYRQALGNAGLIASMSRRANCSSSASGSITVGAGRWGARYAPRTSARGSGAPRCCLRSVSVQAMSAPMLCP